MQDQLGRMRKFGSVQGLIQGVIDIWIGYDVM